MQTLRKILIGLLLVSLCLKGPLVVVASEDDSNVPETFSDLSGLVNNLNLVQPFASPEQIDELNKLVRRLQELQAKGSKADPAKLKDAADALATKLDDQRKQFLASLGDPGVALTSELKDALQKACKTVSQQSLKQIFTSVAGQGKSPLSEDWVRDRFAPNEECASALRKASRELANDIKQLDARIAQLDEEIKAAEAQMRTATDENQRKELGKQVEAKKAEKKEIEEKRSEKVKAKGKIDWGLVLSGIANIAIGFALTVFTGGWGAVLGEAMIKGGLALIGSGLLPLTKSKDEFVERTNKKIIRTDVVEGGEPTSEEVEKIKNTLQKQGLTPISIGTGGNIIVATAPEGYWQVIQIEPNLIILTITSSMVDPSANDKGITGLAGLVNPKVTKIAGGRTELVIDFEASTSSNVPIRGRLTEVPGMIEKILLSVE